MLLILHGKGLPIPKWKRTELRINNKELPVHVEVPLGWLFGFWFCFLGYFPAVLDCTHTQNSRLKTEDQHVF